MFVAVGVAWFTGFRRSSAIAAALILCIVDVRKPYAPDSEAPISSELSSVRKDLPLVAASGLTFLELDHYENEEITSRLHFLVDRAAAIEYAHSTIFENFPVLANYFPIRAHVSPYAGFVTEHPHFMVVTRPDYLEAWLVKKLVADGAKLTLGRSLRGAGKDYQLYEVEWHSQKQSADAYSAGSSD
jgi:hypothetical protein